MNSDFIYPDIADRSGVEEWLANGQPNLITSANTRARNILQTPPVPYIADKTDQIIRDHYDIRLNRLS
jgi:trimethylamine:corrinoid methyltransferase-like protein